MSYRETDGPFGLLPKKTAMDLEWFGRSFPAPSSRDLDLKGHPNSELETSATLKATRPEAEDHDKVSGSSSH